jgi:hypothetical protein
MSAQDAIASTRAAYGVLAALALLARLVRA